MKLNISLFIFLFFTLSIKAQWIQQTSGTASTLSSIHCADSMNCTVVGTTTSLRRTTDGGTTWNQQTSVGITNKTFVKMYSKDTIVLGQINGTFKRSTNGSTWSADIFGGNSNFALYDVAFLSSLNFTAVGGNPTNHLNGGHITTSSVNTGASWPAYVNVSGEPTFFGIHAFNASTFVACGGASSVYKSTDAGATWIQKLSGTPITTTLYDLNFPTPAIGYAVGGNSSAPTIGGVVYKTTDGGETWVSASTGLLPNTLFGVHFISADTGYVVGDGGYIQITINGGASWATQISPVTTTLNKIHFPTNKTGYIAGANGVIIKTTTGGFIAPFVANAGSDASICLGACATLVGSATGGTMPYTYSWSSSAGTTSAVQVCPTSEASYTLTITDANNLIAKDSVKVIIYTNPTVSFTGLASAYCNKTSADVLSGSPSGGTFSGPGVSAGVFNAVVAGIGTHTVTYTYTTTPGCVLSTSQTTVVLPSPGPISLCLVTVDSTNNNVQNYVVWEKPATTNIDSFKIYRKIFGIMTALGSVDYNASSMFIDAANGVSPKTTAHEYAISVIDTCGKESALSASHFTMHQAAPTYISPTSFALSWTDYTGFAVTDYEVWRDGNGTGSWTQIATVPFSAANTYTDNSAPTTSVRYRIRATAPANCTASGSTIFKYSLSNISNDYTSVSEISLSSKLKVYPNPNRGTFNVELSGTGYEVSDINLYNALGEMIYHTSEKNISEITIPAITPGVYHLEIITDKGTANKKVTIE